jgi:hypothetical protein
MIDSYYFGAAASILSALEDKGEARVLMARALHLGCVAMRRLVDDLGEGGEMAWAIRHLTSPEMKEVAPEAIIPRSAEGITVEEVDWRAAERIKGAAELLRVFATEEEKALRRAGIPEPAVVFIMSQAKECIELLDRAIRRKSANQLTWLRLEQSAKELAGEVCSQSLFLESDLKTRKYANKCAYLLAGAGTIKLNVSVDAITTLGLLPWMTAWSGKLGAGIWAKGAGLIPFPGKSPDAH